jgi:hypothetical protein
VSERCGERGHREAAHTLSCVGRTHRTRERHAQRRAHASPSCTTRRRTSATCCRRLPRGLSSTCKDFVSSRALRCVALRRRGSADFSTSRLCRGAVGGADSSSPSPPLPKQQRQPPLAEESGRGRQPSAGNTTTSASERKTFNLRPLGLFIVCERAAELRLARSATAAAATSAAIAIASVSCEHTTATASGSSRRMRSHSSLLMPMAARVSVSLCMCMCPSCQIRPLFECTFCLRSILYNQTRRGKPLHWRGHCFGSDRCCCRCRSADSCTTQHRRRRGQRCLRTSARSTIQVATGRLFSASIFWHKNHTKQATRRQLR